MITLIIFGEQYKLWTSIHEKCIFYTWSANNKCNALKIKISLKLMNLWFMFLLHSVYVSLLLGILQFIIRLHTLGLTSLHKYHLFITIHCRGIKYCKIVFSAFELWCMNMLRHFSATQSQFIKIFVIRTLNYQNVAYNHYTVIQFNRLHVTSLPYVLPTCN
jgi:hypothetical protein